MRIEVKGRNLPISAELREAVEKQGERMARQISPLAELEVVLEVQRTGGTPDCHVADATLRLKGTTLRTRKASPDLRRSISMVADDLERQVKRHADKRRGRRESRAATADERAMAEAEAPMAMPVAAEAAATA
jgi:putative sigma-54 modulation protein